jgi:hypothetical protein
MRAAVRRATTLILRAEDELVEVGSVIANGYLRLDREEWIRVVENARLRSLQLPQELPHELGRRCNGYHEPHQGGGVHARNDAGGHSMTPAATCAIRLRA